MRNKKDSLYIITFLLLLVVQYAVVPTGTAIANDDVIVDFGASGTWVLYDNADWSKLHSGTPENVVTGDLDGNGQGEAIIDFGNSGIWVRTNNESWSRLHSMNPSIMAIGDIDGNYADDIVIDYGSGAGIWVYLNNTSWKKLHSLSTETIVTGDIDGNGQDDIVLDFGAGTGIWLYLNNTSWEKLHRASPEIIATGNMDGNLKEDVIMDFGAAGIWVWKNNRTWIKLHSLSAEIIKSGDLDGNGKDDLIFDFGFGTGIWAKMNDANWEKIHSLTPELIDVGDVDGNGKDDVMIDFGSLHGLWVRYDSNQWKQHHKVSPEIMACGDMSGSNNITYTFSGIVSIPGVDSPGRLWLVVYGDDNIYGMGASDTGGNFSIQASVPANTERVLIIAVMPDNPEFYNRGYVELDNNMSTQLNESSNVLNPRELSIIDDIDLDSQAFAEALVTDFTGHSPDEFSSTELAAAQNISNIVGTDQNQPKFCSDEKNPGIISTLSDVVGTNQNQPASFSTEDNPGIISALSETSDGLLDKWLGPFDDFVIPGFNISQVQRAADYASDRIYSWNQPGDHFGWTVPFFGPLIGTSLIKGNLLFLDLPCDDPTIQTSDIDLMKLTRAAFMIMREGNGNCGEHAIIGAYLATRFPHYKQVAFVAKVGSGDSRHAFAIACEKETKAQTGWDLKELIHKTASDDIPSELYEHNCVYIDSWTPEARAEKITPEIDNKYKDVWENIVFDHIMKVDLSQRDNEMQSQVYQAEQSEEFLSIQLQVISPTQASAAAGTCPVNPGPGPSCKDCPSDAKIAATVCKSFSIDGPFYETDTTMSAIWGWPDNKVIAAGYFNNAAGGYKIYRYDGTTWTESVMKLATGANVPNHGYISDLWGSSPDNVYAVTIGDGYNSDWGYYYRGKILHYNGTSWEVLSDVPDYGGGSFTSIWGSGPSNIYATGMDHGVIPYVGHFNGSTWSGDDLTFALNYEDYANDIHGNASGDIYIAGEFGIPKLFDTDNGPEWLRWQDVLSGFSSQWQGIWVAPDGHVFAVNFSTSVAHFNGSSWEQMDVSQFNTGSYYILKKVWGRSSSDVYVVGKDNHLNDGTWIWDPVVLHFDGTSWSKLQLPEGIPSFGPRGVWGSQTGDMFVAGVGGILRLENDN
jgi:hypothetical protein